VTEEPRVVLRLEIDSIVQISTERRRASNASLMRAYDRPQVHFVGLALLFHRKAAPCSTRFQHFTSKINPLLIFYCHQKCPNNAKTPTPIVWTLPLEPELDIGRGINGMGDIVASRSFEISNPGSRSGQSYHRAAGVKNLDWNHIHSRVSPHPRSLTGQN
jgi:hypothetical protein